jgi:hypothetical protein
MIFVLQFFFIDSISFTLQTQKNERLQLGIDWNNSVIGSIFLSAKMEVIQERYAKKWDSFINFVLFKGCPLMMVNFLFYLESNRDIM